MVECECAFARASSDCGDHHRAHCHKNDIHVVCIQYDVLRGIYPTSCRDGDLNFDTGFQADTRDLLDNLARGVEVDQAFVDFEFVAIPGLGSLTARRLAGGDLEDLGWETNGALHAKLLVLGAVDEVKGKLFEVLDIAAGEGDANFVEFCGGQRSTGCVVFLIALSDVTHDGDRGDCKGIRS